MFESKKYIPPNLLQILFQLEEKGYQSWLVGGAIRDALLGCISTDFDLATSARPEEIISVLADQYKLIKTGIAYGTIGIILADRLKIEITSFRTEANYSDLRRPDHVSFETDILTDLGRRDFTINALAWHPSRELLDPYGGISDLENRLIRAVGLAENRFSEDPLRILRAIRFASNLGFDLENATKKAAFNLKNLLHNIAKERIQDEWDSFLLGQNWLETFIKYQGIIVEILPCFANNINDVTIDYKRCIEVTTYHNIDQIENIAVKNSILAYLTNSDMTAVRENIERLKFSKQYLSKLGKILGSISNVKRLLHNDEKNDNLTKKSNRFSNYILWQMIKEFELANLKIALEVLSCSRATSRDNLLQFEQALNEYSKKGLPVQIKDLFINGKDIMSYLSISEGEEIGKILNLLLLEIVSERVGNSRAEQIEWLKSYRKK